MRSKSRSNPLLVVLLIAALIFAVYYYIVKPKLDEKSSLEHMSAALEQEIGRMQKQIDQYEQSTSSQEELAAQQIKVPPQKNVVNLLQDIERIGAESHSKIARLQFSGYDIPVTDVILQEANQTVITPQPQLKKMIFTINTESTSQVSLTRFVKKLEELERIMRIEGISFSVPETVYADSAIDRFDEYPYKATIQVSAYYYQ